MVMKRWQNDSPELLQEKVIRVRMEEMVKVEVDAPKAGIDTGGLPLDEGA